MDVLMRGAAGRLCWSYHVAAELGKFSISAIRKSKKSALRAMVVSADPFKVQQSPLVFEVLITNGDGRTSTLQYALEDVVIKDGVLSAVIV